jgi:hypothetical protein
MAPSCLYVLPYFISVIYHVCLILISHLGHVSIKTDINKLFYSAGELTISAVTIANLHDCNEFHLFFMVDDLDSLGVSSNFIGGFQWDLSCKPGQMSSKSVVNRLRTLLRPDCGLTVPSSPHRRLLDFYELWDGAYSTTGIQNVYLYYMPQYEDDFFVSHTLSKKLCILSILSWGVPFVPFPIWTVFIIRQSVLRDAGSFTNLRLKTARHHFYVSNCLLDDSRSSLDLAIEESGVSAANSVETLKSFNAASALLADYSRVSRATPPPARRSHSPLSRMRSPPARGVSPPGRRSPSPRHRRSRSRSRSPRRRRRSASPRKRSRSSSTDSSTSESSSSSSSESSSSSSASDSDQSSHERSLRKKIAASSSAVHGGRFSPKSRRHARSKKSKKSKKKSKSSKRKRSRIEGHHHFHNAVSELDKSIKRGSFIDFFAYTPARMDLLKQLGSTSKPSSQLPGSNIWISTSAPAIPDPAVVLRSKENLASGFYFYLSRLNLSTKKAHLSHDRVLWWSWLNTKFHDNDRALLYFACNFVLKHHASDHWAIDAENASHLYSDAKSSCAKDAPDSTPSSGRNDHRSSKKLIVKSKSSSSNSRSTNWTPDQKKAIHAMCSKCPPNTCLSRIIKGHPCHAIKKGIACKFLHVCGWCKSATCEATCAKAPTSPV